jgi:hypothetical protein
MQLGSERGAADHGQPIFLRALQRALLRPTAWLLGSGALAALALVLTLPTRAWFEQTLERGTEPHSQTYSLDAGFRADEAEGLSQLFANLSSSAGWLALLATLLGVFTAGGWIGTLIDSSRTSVPRRYFQGGVRYYWRFLRLALLFLVLLDLLGRLLLGELWNQVVLEDWMGWRGGRSEAAESELTVRRLEWLQHGLHALGFAGLWVWATYTRVRVVLQSQSSVFLAALRTLWTLLCHPVQTLRPLLLLFLVDLLLLFGLGLVARYWLDGGLREDPAAWRVTGLWIVSLLVLLWREVADGARYAAALQVSERVIRPLRPDPWKERIGGPGGPQYPISDEDEFSVSM